VRYRCYGLTIASDIPLPLERASGVADVEVRRVALAGPIPDARYRLLGPDGEQVQWGLAVAGETVSFWFSDAGSVRVDVDRRLIEVDAGGAPQRVAKYVLVSGLSCLAPAMGLLALHAGSVARGDTALAVCGPSGRGKSTAVVSLAFAGRGWRVLHDDLTIITRGGLAQPGPRQAELLEQSAQALGIPCRGQQTSVPLASAGPAPLRAVIALAPRDQTPCLQVLSPIEAAARLGCEGGWWTVLTEGGRVARFELLGDLARSVPCYAWSPPSGIAAAAAALVDLAASLDTEASRS
jgi:hypothetical protein